MNLEDLNIYKISMEVGDDVWDIVDNWKYFEKDTVGKQLVKAADSIAANIAEGFGRFHYLDKKKFINYSRGSLLETKTWIIKASRRKLVDKGKAEKIISDLDKLAKMTNSFINSIIDQSKS